MTKNFREITTEIGLDNDPRVIEAEQKILQLLRTKAYLEVVFFKRHTLGQVSHITSPRLW